VLVDLLLGLNLGVGLREHELQLADLRLQRRHTVVGVPQLFSQQFRLGNFSGKSALGIEGRPGFL